MFKGIQRLAGLAILSMLLAAFAMGPRQAAAQEETLYDRLGGMDAITAVVDEFVANVAADERINRFFAGVDIPNLKRLLVEQICAASGGPCEYTGRSMKDAHMGMGLTDADFDALVEDLIMALDAFDVPDQEKTELLTLLGPMRPEIVEVPTVVGMPTTGAADNFAGWLLLSAVGLVGAGTLLRRSYARVSSVEFE